MFGRKLLSVSFGVALVSGMNCSRPLCEVNEGDSRCTTTIGDMAGSSPISVSPLRLHYLSGGKVDIKGIKSGSSVSISQATVMQPLGTASMTYDTSAWSLQVAKLQGFSPGPADLIFMQSGQTYRQRIWLYGTSTLKASKEASYTTSPGSVINWIGVGGGNVFTLNTYQNLSKNRGVYTYQYGATNGFGSGSLISGTLPSYAKAAAALSGLIQLRANTDGSQERVFVGCPYGSSCVDTTQIPASKDTTYQDVDIAGDPLGTFFAFVSTPTGQTKPVLSVLGINSMLPSEQSFSVLGSKLANDSSIGSITAGDFNGDGSTDIAIWHTQPTNSIEVFLRQSDSSFLYDDVRSMSLKAAIGTNALLAWAAGDLDGDGLTDVVIARSNKELRRITNLGDSFSIDQQPININGNSFGSIDGLAIGDVGGPVFGTSQVISDIVFASKAEFAFEALINTLM